MAHRKILEQDESELEIIAEAELSKLKKQYRTMEKERVAYVEDARLQLRSQQNIIDRLEFEKAELILAIRSAKSDTNVKREEILTAKLRQVLNQREKYIEMIKNEKQQIADLQEQIFKVSKEIQDIKKQVRTDMQTKEMIAKRTKTISILENRLEVATRRFNSVVDQNTKYRRDIDGLLKERGQFNELWNKLIAQLNTGKGVIYDLIEQATITFNQRDEELNKINALRERGTRDLKSHTSEMCELQRTLDNEIKLQQFLSVKSQFREMGDLNQRRESEKLSKKEELQQKIAVYSDILKQLKSFSGEENMDNLAMFFVKQEEENFALFNYVNELNDELESLHSRVQQLRTAIDEARALNVHRSEQQSEMLDKITKELEKQTALAEKAEENLAECNDVMDKLLKGVEGLFTITRCDNSPLLELLGDNSHVTMSNIMLYLGIIEKKITSMFNKVYWVDKATKEARLDENKRPRLKVPLLAQTTPTQPCVLCAEKEEMQVVSEGQDIPLTLEEAQKKLDLRLQDDHSELLHNVSGCHLPAARKIMQRRYQ